MQTWQPNRKEAFLNPVIINTIQSAYFGNPRATGFQYVNQFSSSVLSKPNEKELPAALLALAITAVSEVYLSCMKSTKTISRSIVVYMSSATVFTKGLISMAIFFSRQIRKFSTSSTSSAIIDQ
jgi:hypothetical protein